MDQAKKQVKWSKFVPWVIIAVLLIGGYFAYKANFVTITRHEYGQLQIKGQAEQVK